PRAAARLAIGAARRARTAKLAEAETQALEVYRGARRRATVPSRYDDAMTSPPGPSDGIAWAWIAKVADGLSVDEAAIELGRAIAKESRAERIFIATYDEALAIRRVWGVDLDGFPISNAEERVDRTLALSALSSQGPVYQRDVESPGGRGARLGVA